LSRSSTAVEVAEESDLKAVVEYRRNGSDNWRTVTWTIQQARDLGLTSKDNWKKQPKSMLVARATSEAARRVASDALLGIPYSSEELQDAQPEPTRTVARKPVQRAPKPAAPEPEFDEPAEPVKATAERTDEISPAQLKALNAGLTGLGITDRDTKLATVAQIIDREIGSSKELTRAEASRVIDWIKTEESNAPAEPPLDDAWPDVAPVGAE
jgi:hypothetical protein